MLYVSSSAVRSWARGDGSVSIADWAGDSVAGVMMEPTIPTPGHKRQRSPQDKKQLSLERDRRNTYGESDKGPRKIIPLQKAKANRTVRSKDKSALRRDEDSADSVLKKALKQRWRKAPDGKLGDVIAGQLNEREYLRRTAGHGPKGRRRAFPREIESDGAGGLVPLSGKSYLYIGCPPEKVQKLKEIAAGRGLASLMNDTKWRELCLEIQKLPFPPSYQSKSLYEEQPRPSEVEHASTGWGDWAKSNEASFGFHIEWIKIVPRYQRHIGLLVKPEIVDCSHELRSALVRLRLPFVEEHGFFTVYGHARGIEFNQA
jgi:hypothetical protein